jgi:hypothetical protein
MSDISIKEVIEPFVVPLSMVLVVLIVFSIVMTEFSWLVFYSTQDVCSQVNMDIRLVCFPNGDFHSFDPLVDKEMPLFYQLYSRPDDYDSVVVQCMKRSKWRS